MNSVLVTIIVSICISFLTARIEAIIGGIRAKPWEFPYIVLLKETYHEGENNETSTGSVIGSRFVMTAIDPDKKDDILSIDCYFGIIRDGDLYQMMRVLRDQIFLHDDYGEPSNEEELFKEPRTLAILKLSEPLDYELIKPVSFILPGEFDVQHEIAAMAGYGQATKLLQGSQNNTTDKTPDTGSGSDSDEKNPDGDLYKLYHRILSSRECSGVPGMDFNKFVCAMPITQPGEACYHDEGSPLVIRSGKKYLIVGVLAGIRENCEPPSVFFKVEHYLDWIKKITFPQFNQGDVPDDDVVTTLAPSKPAVTSAKPKL